MFKLVEEQRGAMTRGAEEDGEEEKARKSLTKF